MKKKIIAKIKKQAKLDEKNRKDPRFLNTMGFLVAKGFLKTNLNIPLLPNKKLFIEDVLWAAENVEPRILEVLPAAVLRLKKHFILNPIKHQHLLFITDCLRKDKETKELFYGIPYKKVKIWIGFDLKDKRIKKLAEKRVVKTFRLRQEVLTKLKTVSKKLKITETEALERKILRD